MAQYNELETITRMINSLESRIKSLETSGRLFASGIGAGGINVHNKGTIRIEDGGSVNIYDGGNLEVYGTSTQTGTIKVGSGGKVIADGPVSFSKSSTFGGNVSITGNLTVRGNITIKSGLIKSNALKNQMSSATTTRSSRNFSISTDYVDKVSATLTAPSWATKALVYVSGDVYFNAGIGDARTPSLRTRIQGTYSKATSALPIRAMETRNSGFTGTSHVINNPKTIDAAIQVKATTTAPANSANSSTINMIGIFYR